MGTHVLVPVDGSPQAWVAFEHALEMDRVETITALHVVDPTEGVYSDYGGGGYYDPEAHDRAVKRGERLGEEARTRFEEAGIAESVLETAIETGRPARTIIDYADSSDVDHIVMGSHGRSGVSRVLLGSVAELVARRASVPVTIVR